MTPAAQAAPVLPDYRGACLTNILPALLQHGAIGQGWIPDDVLDAKQAVVLLVDGLGWEQFDARRHLAPTLDAFAAQAITTVAPSTTAVALSSFTTGGTPGDHGLVGYRMRIDGQILNALRWTTSNGLAVDTIPPADIQVLEPFLNQPVPVVMSGAFIGSGFTQAHLRGGELVGYRLDSGISVEVGRLNRQGHRLVYAYWDGIDLTAHIHGFGDHYDAELRNVDRMVADIAAAVSPGTAIVVVADHGQVHVGDAMVTLHPEVMALTEAVSGEARFTWLHARPDRAAELAERCRQHHGDDAWVRTRQQVLDEGWFGPVVHRDAAERLGEVAVVARTDVGFAEPDRPSPLLQGRHGGLTSAEMYIPLLTTVT